MTSDSRKAERFWEGSALVTGLGCVIAIGVALLVVLEDWRTGQLKALWNYLRLIGVICLPFLSLFLISTLLLWRWRQK